MKAPPQMHDDAGPRRSPQASPTEAAAERSADTPFDQSPRALAQRRRLDVAFGAIQRQPVEAQTAANRTGMPDELKTGIETMSGMDLSDVRVHANSGRPAQLGAHAYAQGNEIHLAPGQEQHLPHEAWHVVQQRQGKVQPTMQVGGLGVNDDESLEHEADVMGSKAAQAVVQAAGLDVRLAPARSGAADVVQMVRIELKAGKIKLPRIYQDPFDADHYVVTDFAGPDIDYFTEINRMCNVMSILWAKRMGAPGNVGFWDFSGADQLLMATWAAEDVSVPQQLARAESELSGLSVDADTFAAIVRELADGSDACGVLASDVHAVAFVMSNGRIRVYDPMDGAVTINSGVADFAAQFARNAEIYGWTSIVLHS